MSEVDTSVILRRLEDQGDCFWRVTTVVPVVAHCFEKGTKDENFRSLCGKHRRVIKGNPPLWRSPLICADCEELLEARHLPRGQTQALLYPPCPPDARPPGTTRVIFKSGSELTVVLTEDEAANLAVSMERATHPGAQPTFVGPLECGGAIVGAEVAGFLTLVPHSEPV